MFPRDQANAEKCNPIGKPEGGEVGRHLRIKERPAYRQS